MKSNVTTKPYALTKSKVISGLQCHKKLWLDTNAPIKQELHIFHIGNRFGEFARNYYGSGVDLTGNLDATSAIAATQTALNDSSVSVIYESAFLYDDTLVRVDVLRRLPHGWEMIEVKSSTSLKDEHIKDASVQAYIAQSCGITLCKIQIAHINKAFVYPGNAKYGSPTDENLPSLLISHDITQQVLAMLPVIPDWIATLKPLAILGATMPAITMGPQCVEPYNCPHQDRCSTPLPKLAEVPISILPNSGGTLAKTWAMKNIYDLRDLPESALSNSKHKVIQKAHQSGATWISPAAKSQIQNFEWPRYFMDFETVQQGVPLMSGTKAYDALPFQWSVHRWDHADQALKLEDGMGYLTFYDPNMDRDFLSTLLAAVGSRGPIFAHHASFEIRILRELIERPTCSDLANAVKALINRIIDTEVIAKEGFYAPLMMGSNSLKQIVKAIPTSVDYSSDESLSGGGEAQIAWFKCTDPATPLSEKLTWERKLKHYCAQDTLAMYDFIKYISES